MIQIIPLKPMFRSQSKYNSNHCWTSCHWSFSVSVKSLVIGILFIK